MSKVRVHELAKELGVSSKEVLAKFQELGIWVKSASSAIDPPAVRKLRAAMTSPTAPEPVRTRPSGKIRVFELAKELGTTSKVVLAVLQGAGEFVPSASSELAPAQAAIVRERVAQAREIANRGAQQTPVTDSPAATAPSSVTPLSLPRAPAAAPRPPAPTGPPRGTVRPVPVSRHSVGEHFWSGKGDAGYPERPEDVEPAGPPSRMLAYRSFVTLRQGGDEVGPRLEELVLEWVRKKNLPVDALSGTYRSRDGRLALTTVQHLHEGRAVGVRYRLVDSKESGTWIVTITIGMQSRDWTYLLVDVESSPDPRPNRDGTYRAMLAAPPAFVRGLISDFNALDADTQVTLTPTVVDVGEVEWLISAIKDPERRGLMTVAGPPDGDSAWITKLERVHEFAAGLVSPYVLTAEAHELYSAAVPPQLGIEVKGLRAFRPGTDFDSLASLRRNRGFLSSTIATEPAKKLARTLGYEARDTQVQRPLPTWAREAQTHLDRLERNVPIRRLRSPAPASAPPGAPVVEHERPAAAPPEAAPIAADTPSPSAPAALEVALMDRLLDIVELLGADRELTSETIEKMEDAVLASQITPWTVDDLRAQLESTQAAADSYQSELYDLRGDFEDAQLDHLEDLERFEIDRARLLHLEKQMHRIGQSQVVTDSYLVEVSSPPGTFADLIARVNTLDTQVPDAELAWIVFTGDRAPTLELDELDPSGAWAAKTWEALRALNDYAQLKSDRAFDGSFETYCQDTPSGWMEWPATQHVMSEGEQVNTNPTFWQPRVLPVPTEIDTSGRTFMEAHIRISRRRSVSPRLHYLDATTRTKFVYVGYIGRHLPNTLSN